MTSEELRLMLMKHLEIDAHAESDYDTYGSSNSVVVRLVWVHDDGTREEMCRAEAYTGRESR